MQKDVAGVINHRLSLNEVDHYASAHAIQWHNVDSWPIDKVNGVDLLCASRINHILYKDSKDIAVS